VRQRRESNRLRRDILAGARVGSFFASMIDLDLDDKRLLQGCRERVAKETGCLHDPPRAMPGATQCRPVGAERQRVRVRSEPRTPRRRARRRLPSTTRTQLIRIWTAQRAPGWRRPKRLPPRIVASPEPLSGFVGRVWLPWNQPATLPFPPISTAIRSESARCDRSRSYSGERSYRVNQLFHSPA
jgi:hypothetical protein